MDEPEHLFAGQRGPRQGAPRGDGGDEQRPQCLLQAQAADGKVRYSACMGMASAAWEVCMGSALAQCLLQAQAADGKRWKEVRGKHAWAWPAWPQAKGWWFAAVAVYATGSWQRSRAVAEQAASSLWVPHRISIFSSVLVSSPQKQKAGCSLILVQGLFKERISPRKNPSIYTVWCLQPVFSSPALTRS